MISKNSTVNPSSATPPSDAEKPQPVRVDHAANRRQLQEAINQSVELFRESAKECRA